ncbi:hypothetical protein MOC30_14485 [Bacillus spizizenii]|nr:hypothetical protein [Bacillus spizizenii]
MMKTFNIADVKKNLRFPALTQDENVTINELIDTCNAEQSLVVGFVKTRKSVLHNRFDIGALKDYINLVPHYDSKNKFLVLTIKNLIEKISRDMIDECMVEDFVKATKLKLNTYDGDAEKVATVIEDYFRCGKLVSMSTTWNERIEEIKKGKVIYHEPSRTV